jgi:hypothetical protein
LFLTHLKYTEMMHSMVTHLSLIGAFLQDNTRWEIFVLAVAKEMWSLQAFGVLRCKISFTALRVVEHHYTRHYVCEKTHRRAEGRHSLPLAQES